jgi:CRP/FNR family transcriptional regulator, cyclic AMP receptor protein
MAQRTNTRGEDLASAKGWANVLAGVPLFAGLSSRHLRSVAQLGTIQRFHSGTEFVRKGEPGNVAYVVLDGDCEIVRGRGKARLPIGEGSIVGEMSLIDGRERSATVVATSDVTMFCLGRNAFHALLRKEPALALRLLETLAQRLRDAERDDSAV